jgi:hypothetical protein
MYIESAEKFTLLSQAKVPIFFLFQGYPAGNGYAYQSWHKHYNTVPHTLAAL